MKHFDLAAVQAKQLPRMEWREILTENAEHPLSAEDVATLDEYFRRFTHLPKNACPGCDHRLTADNVAASFFGLASFTWGIANGEGHCAQCGYPARAYHRNIGDLIKLLNVVLPYHPDELSAPVPSPAVSEVGVEA